MQGSILSQHFSIIWPGLIGTWVDCAFCPTLPYIRLVCVKNLVHYHDYKPSQMEAVKYPDITLLFSARPQTPIIPLVIFK